MTDEFSRYRTSSVGVAPLTNGGTMSEPGSGFAKSDDDVSFQRDMREKRPI